MISLVIPGFKRLTLSHLALDFNGTLAFDGILIPGVAEMLSDLASQLTLHVITGDTYGTAKEQLSGVPCQLLVLREEHQGLAKREFIRSMGSDMTVAIGNGRNDVEMVQRASLGIVVVGPEGAASETIHAADIVTNEIHTALAMLLRPLRLIATLRS